jgi:hypothetical protein
LYEIYTLLVVEILFRNYVKKLHHSGKMHGPYFNEKRGVYINSNDPGPDFYGDFAFRVFKKVKIFIHLGNGRSL